MSRNSSLDETRLDEEKEYGARVSIRDASMADTPTTQFANRRFKRRIAIHFLQAVLICAAVYAFLVYRAQTAKPVQKVPENPRKAVVISSYKGQDLGWLTSMPDDWEIFRYVMDDPKALYHPPVNSGREAMAYTSFIIDQYDNLPDYVVFIHGHRRAWHQPEPINWRIPTLNLEALERDQYINLMCIHLTNCHAAPRLNLTMEYQRLDRTARLIPWFWRYAEISDTVPDIMSWPESAQFAVSKAAILRRSRDWWIRLRRPMLFQDDAMYAHGSQGYFWGLLFERIWHVIFGMPAHYCLDVDYCSREQWSNGVLCDAYPALPLGMPWISHSDILNYVTCFRNTNNTQDWVLKPWSLCNTTEYLASKNPQCPFTGWLNP